MALISINLFSIDTCKCVITVDDNFDLLELRNVRSSSSNDLYEIGVELTDCECCKSVNPGLMF